MYREEFEAGDPAHDEPHAPGDDFGSGPTHTGKKARTITATPVGWAPDPARPDDAPVAPPMVEDGDGPTLRSEEPQATPAGILTRHMPANRPSRRFEPLPLAEPSVTVRPSVELPAEVTASQTQSELEEAASEVLTVPRSNVPLIIVLATLVVGLLAAVSYVSGTDSRAPSGGAPPSAPAGDAVEAPVPQPEILAQTLAETSPPPSNSQLDAGLPSLAEAAPPAKPLTPDTSPVALAPVVRKMGTLSVKAVPYATVVVQGRSYEVTGVQKVPAPVGTYEITLTHPKRTIKQRVTVQANETTSVSSLRTENIMATCCHFSGVLPTRRCHAKRLPLLARVSASGAGMALSSSRAHRWP